MNRKKRGKVSAGHGRIKLQLEEMDRANAISRRLSGYRQETPVDRERSAVTNWLRKEWKESMIDFQKMVHTQAILIVMLASFTGFGGAMCGTTVIYELMKWWRNRRSLSAQPNTSQEAIRPVQTSDNNQTPQLDPEQQNGSTGIGRGS